MMPLICIPAVAVILVFILWAVLRPRISFEHFPLPDYRKELEFAVFFLPGGLAGWFSILVANSYLSDETRVFNLAWSLGLIVAFVIWEFAGILSLAQAEDLFKAAQDADGRDFIAMGGGYAVGVLLGTYDIIVHQPQPPRIFFALDDATIEDIFIFLGVIALLSLNVTLQQYMRKRRKKANRRKSASLRTKNLSAPEPEANVDSLPASEDLADVDEDPTD